MNLSINKRNYQKERHEESFHISVFRVHRNPFANGPDTKKQKQTFYKSLFYKSASNSGSVHAYPDIFGSPTFQLFLSGYENIRVHTLCDHSVFKSNSLVHTYSDSLRIH